MSNSIPQNALEHYDALVNRFPEVERKGKTMPYTSTNGYMFSHLSVQGEMGLRLSSDDREKFLSKYNTELFVQHGRTMKEFVAVPASLLASDDLDPWFQKSIEYTTSLKPKK